ncbi:MAG: EAL domain-containing protein [Magnetococcales bacterium]|nr:EAL domain-containing protein [Magnetococcales bacterium]
MKTQHINGTILVVDDAHENIQILYKILKNEYQVLFATNGKDAIKSAMAKKPDIILLDIVMPGMDGLEVCKALQENSTTVDIPVIFITGKNDIETETKGFACGAVDFITKPINPTVVRARVQTHIIIKKQRDSLENSNAQLIREIQERKKLEDQLRKQAEFDSLTTLPNRKLFQDRLGQAILLAQRTLKPIALMFIDLDRFKGINDTLGHDAGDELLIEAANRLSRSVRKSDTVARFGGDEFTVILPQIEHTSMVDLVARKILEQMRLPFRLKKQNVTISSSIGISIYPSDGVTIEELLKNADSAMYQAKESGRNNLKFYSMETNQKIHKQLQLEVEIHNALLNGEFFLDFQPKIKLTTSKITGMEALVRWDHPEDGILSPNEFIPIAEKTGGIIQIDAWVLNSACSQAEKWLRNGFADLKLAVNISALHFREDGALIKLVEETLKKTGFPADRLELEITESMMVNNWDRAVTILNKLQSLGITIYMDDFGTGYSSLSMLKHLPIQALKIDRSFIHSLEHDNKNKAFIAAIISMAKQLDITVIAEGVESQEQLQILKNHGGTEVQGFFFSPPLGSKAFLKLLQGQIPFGMQNKFAQ